VCNWTRHSGASLFSTNPTWTNLEFGQSLLYCEAAGAMSWPLFCGFFVPLIVPSFLSLSLSSRFSYLSFYRFFLLSFLPSFLPCFHLAHWMLSVPPVSNLSSPLSTGALHFACGYCLLQQDHGLPCYTACSSTCLYLTLRLLVFTMYLFRFTGTWNSVGHADARFEGFLSGEAEGSIHLGYNNVSTGNRTPPSRECSSRTHRL